MTSNDFLAVFLHGIGSSGAQLLPLAAAWRTSLPNARFVLPDAPFHHSRGHQWFSVDGLQLQPARMLEIREAFDDTIHALVAKAGFERALDRVAFVGVSQGAIVALDAVAMGRWKIGALVSFAGLLPPGPVSSDSNVTPILMSHGQADRTIPAFASTMAAARLGSAGFAVQLDVQEGVGHTISPEGGQAALRFLRKTFEPCPVR